MTTVGMFGVACKRLRQTACASAEVKAHGAVVIPHDAVVSPHGAFNPVSCYG